MITSGKIYREFIHQHRVRIGIAFVAGLAARITALAIPLVIGRYCALRFGYASFRSQVFQGLGDGWLLEQNAFLITMLGLVAIWFVLRYGERFHTSMLGELLVKKLREELFQKQLHTAPHAFALRNAGKYLLRYSGDLKHIQNFFNLGLMAFVRDLAILVPAALLFAAMLPDLALPSLVGFMLLLFPLMVLNRWLYRASVRRRDQKSGLLAFVSDRLYRHGVIQAFNRENPEMGRFRRRSEKLTEAGRHYFQIEALIRTLIPSLVYLIPGLMFFWVEWNAVGGSSGVDPESLSLAGLLLIAIAPVFRRIAMVTVHWELGKLSMRKLLVVMNLESPKSSDFADLEPQKYGLEFEGLSFNSASETVMVENWSAAIGPVGLTWIGGPTGSGKTQLIRILLQLKAPSAGRICIDGIDLAECNPKSVRKQIAVVSDAWPLLGKTVFEVISYSRKPEKRAAAESVLNRLQAGISPHLRMELDDKTGEQCNLLSAGQTSLLMLARAFLTRKRILILDEPFRDLDQKSLEVVVRRLNSLRNKRNILILSSHPAPETLKPDQTLVLGSTSVPTTDTSKLIRKLA